MPKEFHEFDMTKPPGASWGIRIGGGVDRGKVLVLEKVSRFLPFVSFAKGQLISNRFLVSSISSQKRTKTSPPEVS